MTLECLVYLSSDLTKDREKTRLREALYISKKEDRFGVMFLSAKILVSKEYWDGSHVLAPNEPFRLFIL